MLRETGFVLGGSLLLAAGVLFFVILFLLGADWWAYTAYVGALLMVGFGVFFVHVGRSEGADRRRELREMEHGSSPPPP